MKTGSSFIVTITYHTVASANDDTVILRITGHLSQIIDIRYRSTFAVAGNTRKILTAASPDYRSFVIAISDRIRTVADNTCQIMTSFYCAGIPGPFYCSASSTSGNTANMLRAAYRTGIIGINNIFKSVPDYPSDIFSASCPTNITGIINIRQSTFRVTRNAAYIKSTACYIAFIMHVFYDAAVIIVTNNTAYTIAVGYNITRIIAFAIDSSFIVTTDAAHLRKTFTVNCCAGNSSSII